MRTQAFRRVAVADDLDQRRALRVHLQRQIGHVEPHVLCRLQSIVRVPQRKHAGRRREACREASERNIVFHVGALPPSAFRAVTWKRAYRAPRPRDREKLVSGIAVHRLNTRVVGLDCSQPKDCSKCSALCVQGRLRGGRARGLRRPSYFRFGEGRGWQTCGTAGRSLP